MTGKVTVEEACMSQEELMRILERFDVKKQSSKLHAQLSCGYSS